MSNAQGCLLDLVLFSFDAPTVKIANTCLPQFLTYFSVFMFTSYICYNSSRYT